MSSQQSGVSQVVLVKSRKPFPMWRSRLSFSILTCSSRSKTLSILLEDGTESSLEDGSEETLDRWREAGKNAAAVVIERTIRMTRKVQFVNNMILKITSTGFTASARLYTQQEARHCVALRPRRAVYVLEVSDLN